MWQLTWCMLCGDQDGVHPDGDHSSVLLLVLNSDLRLAIWPQPRHSAILAHLCQLVAYLGGEHVCEGHELWCLVCGIAKHMALVTSTCTAKPAAIEAPCKLPKAVCNSVIGSLKNLQLQRLALHESV